MSVISNLQLMQNYFAGSIAFLMSRSIGLFGLVFLSGSVFLSTGCDHPQAIFAERKRLVETVYASGKIIPGDEFRLASLSNGTVVEKLIKDGDTVQKGQLIYIIQSEAAKERYNAALKNYETVKANLSAESPVLNDLRLAMHNAMLECRYDSSIYARYKILWSENIGTQVNLDNIRLKYEASLNQVKMAKEKYNTALNDLQVSRSTAKSQLASAGNDLKEYFIRSDRDGIVYQTFKEAGETVFSNETVALIGGRNNHVVRMAVDQQDIGRIRKGQKVLIQADITGSKVYEAVVSYIYPVMNEQDQTFRVDALFKGNEPSSFIHSSIEANIIIQQKEQALVLSRNALVGADSVWVNTGRGREKKGIKTGISTLEYIEVLAGLNEQTPVLLVSESNK